LGAGGDWGRETYAKKTANLIATKPAYDAYEAAIKALSEKKITEANTLIKKAIAIEPREAKFQEFLGDIAMTQNKPAEAIIFYDKAIALQPGYFKPHVQGGIALFNLGRKAEAQRYLNAGNALLPTAPSHFLLGKINEERGDITNALMHYEIAASSNSDVGKQSTAQFARLDASKNPARYLKAIVQADDDGHLYAVVQNPTALTVNNVRVRIVQYDANSGRAIGQSEALLIMNAIAPSGRGQIAVRGARISQQREIRLFKVVVEAAQVVK
jgi:tetratricopeptide (TPR) repeat protein